VSFLKPSPYFRSNPKFDGLAQTPKVRYDTYKYTVLDVGSLNCNDKEVLSSKNTPRLNKPYSISNQNGSKNIPFGAAHTYIAHVREYPPKCFV